MSHNEDTVPEPGGEPDSESSPDVLVALQDQMAQMMAMFQTSTSQTGQQIANILAEQELSRRGASFQGTRPTTPPNNGRRNSVGADHTIPVPSPAFMLHREMPRRATSFYGIPDGPLTRKDAPKILTDGSCFTKMKKFTGKPSESIQEHFLTFEYLARTTAQQWWCDCLLETFSTVITTSIINKGLTLRAGRDDTGTCPAGWYDYDELKRWLSAKYHRAQYHLELLCKVFYGYKQTGSLDAYITLIDQKLASCEINIHDDLRKMIVMEHMDSETKKVIVARPATYSQSYEKFCEVAILEYDTIVAAKKEKFVPKNTGKPWQKKEKTALASLENGNDDIHTHVSGGRTYTSPWKPGFKMYENAKPPCNYCKLDSHGMLGCGKLWMKIYGHHPESLIKRPDFATKYLETCDPESLAAFDVLDEEEMRFMADYEVLDTDPEAVLSEAASWDDYDSFFECTEQESEPENEVDIAAVSTRSVKKTVPLESNSDEIASEYLIPNELCYLWDQANRMVLDIEVNGVKTKALVDTGAGITGFAADWFTRSGIDISPSTGRLITAKTITGEPVSTSLEVVDATLTIGPWEGFHNFALLPISSAYSVVLGKDFCKQYALNLNFDENAMNTVIIKNPPRCKKTLQIGALPILNDEEEMLPGVFELCMLESAVGSGHEFEGLSASKFKKLRKKMDYKQTKRESVYRQERHSGPTAGITAPRLSALKTGFVFALCLLATATGQEVPSEKPSTCSLNGLFAQDQEEFPAQIQHLNSLNSENSGLQPENETSNLDPFLVCPLTVLQKVNKLREDCMDVWKEFKSRTYSCFTGMPHESKINRKHEVPMKIVLKDEFKDAAPPPPRTYKTPFHLLAILKKSLIEMLKAGWIRPSTSDWCSPVIIIPKPHQDLANLAPEEVKYRVCVDLSAVNTRTKTEHYRVPDVSSAWDKLSKSKYFSVLDLEKGFWQSKICKTDDSIARTAFSCEFGHYEFVTAPMGAKNSPAHFQSQIESMLRRGGLMDLGVLRVTGPETVKLVNGTPCVHTHIDDLIVYSNTKSDHLRDLDRVCCALSDEQYYCNRDKCFFFCEYVKYVGGIVGQGFLAMDPDKVVAIDTWEQPTTTTEMRGFLGMCNFLRRWYQHYAEDASTLNQLLKKGAQVVRDWNGDHSKAFERIKLAFKTNPILRLPDFDKAFVLHTDSCDHSIGAALLQEHDGHLLPCAYHSRSMNDAEMNYPVRDQEGLALVDGFKKFNYYLRGAKCTVLCHTDHESLKYLSNAQPLTGRLGRWQEYLSGYDFKIVPIKGVKNLVADGISRSITLHTAKHTAVIDTQIEAVEKYTSGTYYDMGAMFVINDSRMDGLDYSKCRHFADTFENLGATDIITYNTKDPKYRYFSRVHDQLFYRLPDGKYALCIPSTAKTEGGHSLREALIQECHDSPYMGHRGSLRTYMEMRNMFYWPGMRSMVDKYCLACVTCMASKASNQGSVGRLKPNEVPLERMDCISMDFITQLPDSSGYTQVCVVVDMLSKKLFLIPFKGTETALQVGRVLYSRIFSEHGVPIQIISDRDTKFTSKIWQNFFKTIGTKLAMSYSYHQRFDGQTEVMNRVIEQVIRCYINFNQDNWLLLLPYVASAINNTVNPSTKLSPNEIYYGRPILRPIHALTRLHEALPDVKDYIQRLDDYKKIAQDYIRMSLIAFSSRHFKGLARSVDPRLVVGSKVMVDSTNLILPGHRQRPSKKFLSQRIGPRMIIKKISDVSYRLEMPRPWRGFCDFHASNLTHVPDDTFTVRAKPEPELIDNESQWVVKTLAAHRTFYRKHQYFVVYKGYTVDEGQWRYRTDLQSTCPALVKLADSKYGIDDSMATLDFASRSTA